MLEDGTYSKTEGLKKLKISSFQQDFKNENEMSDEEDSLSGSVCSKDEKIEEEKKQNEPKKWLY